MAEHHPLEVIVLINEDDDGRCAMSRDGKAYFDIRLVGPKAAGEIYVSSAATGYPQLMSPGDGRYYVSEDYLRDMAGDHEDGDKLLKALEGFHKRYDHRMQSEFAKKDSAAHSARRN